VLSLLLSERNLNSRKLYTEIYERLGEGMITILNKLLIEEEKNRNIKNKIMRCEDVEIVQSGLVQKVEVKGSYSDREQSVKSSQLDGLPSASGNYNRISGENLQRIHRFRGGLMEQHYSL